MESELTANISFRIKPPGAMCVFCPTYHMHLITGNTRKKYDCGLDVHIQRQRKKLLYPINPHIPLESEIKDPYDEYVIGYCGEFDNLDKEDVSALFYYAYRETKSKAKEGDDILQIFCAGRNEKNQNIVLTSCLKSTSSKLRFQNYEMNDRMLTIYSYDRAVEKIKELSNKYISKNRKCNLTITSYGSLFKSAKDRPFYVLKKVSDGDYKWQHDYNVKSFTEKVTKQTLFTFNDIKKLSDKFDLVKEYGIASFDFVHYNNHKISFDELNPPLEPGESRAFKKFTNVALPKELSNLKSWKEETEKSIKEDNTLSMISKARLMNDLSKLYNVLSSVDEESYNKEYKSKILKAAEKFKKRMDDIRMEDYLDDDNIQLFKELKARA